MALSNSPAARIPTFQPGDPVEVRPDSPGLVGSLYAGTILSCDDVGRSVVEHHTIYRGERGEERLVQTLDSTDLRSVRPHCSPDVKFEIGDEVEAFYMGGWWEGHITRSENGRFAVCLDGGVRKTAVLKGKDLRLRMDWADGNWVPQPPRDHVQEALMTVEGSTFARIEGSCHTSMELDDEESGVGNSSQPLNWAACPGMDVEVFDAESGQNGPWIAAIVLSASGKGTYDLRLKNLSTPGGSTVRHGVPTTQMRPTPPEIVTVDGFRKRDVVEAYDEGAWFAGVVAKVYRKSRYSVSIRDKGDAKFEHESLRPLQAWAGGKWIAAAPAGI